MITANNPLFDILSSSLRNSAMLFATSIKLSCRTTPFRSRSLNTSSVLIGGCAMSKSPGTDSSTTRKYSKITPKFAPYLATIIALIISLNAHANRVLPFCPAATTAP
uniref:(northern house mosquito) hypothetical protein n=1 Tax=Culex pipiens TaxID=7175 RepID=A0A8D8FPG1_CULPI